MSMSAQMDEKYVRYHSSETLTMTYRYRVKGHVIVTTQVPINSILFEMRLRRGFSTVDLTDIVK